MAAACSKSPDRWEALRHDLLRQRFTTGRLAGQQAWATCSTADTSAALPAPRCGLQLRAGTREFARLSRLTTATLQTAGSRQPAGAPWVQGLLELRHFEGRASRPEAAVRLLEQARRDHPASAAVLNDLAVAYLALAERTQDLRALLRALDCLERARNLKDGDATILYNRVLVLQRLSLPAEAQRAWQEYSAVETNVQWRSEGASLLLNASAPRLAPTPGDWEGAPDSALVGLARAAPELARDAWQDLLGRWGAALLAGETAHADTLLGRARRVAAAMRVAPGDDTAEGTVQAIERSGPSAIKVLAAAHRDLRDGVRLFQGRQHIEASRPLSRARSVLAGAGSPAGEWAGYYLAASLVQQAAYARADSLFARILREAGTGHHALVGRVHMGLGVSHVRRGNYAQAVAWYRGAEQAVRASGERQSVGHHAYVLAEALDRSGLSSEAGTQSLRALRLLAPLRESPSLANHLSLVGALAESEGLAFASVVIHDEGVSVAEAQGRPDAIAVALCTRARALVAVGRGEEAGADLDRARLLVNMLPDDASAERIRAAVQLARGQIVRATDPGEALPILDSAAVAFARFDSDPFHPAALFQAAEAARQSGDTAHAMERLAAAVRHLERQGTGLMSQEARATFSETMEGVFDRAIELLMASGDDSTAFAYLQRARRLGWGTLGTPALASLATIRDGLPAGSALVEFAVLDGRVVAWTVTGRGHRAVAVPIPRDSLAWLVTRAGEELSRVQVGDADARAMLFDVLLRPLEAEIGAAQHLAIVPDRELNQLAFASLWNRERGEYLVERHALSTLPTAGAVLVLVRSGGLSSVAPVLVVGDPTTGELPGASREADGVAALYRDAVSLRGREATRDQVLSRLANARVLHFAGHAISDSDVPALSYLALAAEPSGSDGRLLAREIGAMRLSNVALVILSACRTMNPRPSRSGAVTGIAYSFIRAGVPATVSTLWDVNDQAAADFVLGIHRGLREGLRPIEALRQAQVNALRSSTPWRYPRVWAAFTYTGL